MALGSMLNTISVFLTCAVLLSLVPRQHAVAQSNALGLSECIATGLRQNADVLRGRNEVERAATFKTQAFGAFLPNLSASGSWSRYDREQIGLRSDGVYFSRDSYSYQVRSGLVLFDGLANFNQADQSILAHQAAEFGYQRRTQDLVYLIQQRYFNVLRARQLVRVSETNLERSRKQLDLVKELNAVGSVPLADVYRQQVQVGRDELAMMQAVNDRDNALIDLQTTIGLAPSAGFDIDASAVQQDISESDITAYRAGLPAEDVMVREAMRARSDVTQSDLSLRAAEKAGSVAFAGHLPTVSAFANYSWNNLELKGFDLYDRFFYGVSIDVPLFSNFTTHTAMQRAEIDRRNAEYSRDELARSIAGELRKALNTLGMAEKTLEISRRTALSAREDYRIASERYSLGAATLLDQIVAASNLTAAESDVVNATFNYLIARKNLEYQLGTLTY